MRFISLLLIFIVATIINKVTKMTFLNQFLNIFFERLTLFDVAASVYNFDSIDVDFF